MVAGQSVWGDLRRVLLPLRGGTVALLARLLLSSKHGRSVQEGGGPEGERAGDKGHGGEAQCGQHEAAAEQTNTHSSMIG